MTGIINERNLVERVETRLYNNVLGDMLVEAIYSDYKDFAGVKFPTRIVQRQGGHPTLDLRVSAVQPNGAPTLDVRENVPLAAGLPTRVEAKKIADGGLVSRRSGAMSYLVEFNDHLVLIEGPGKTRARRRTCRGEAHGAEQAGSVREIKHAQSFDHAGGLRARWPKA